MGERGEGKRAQGRRLPASVNQVFRMGLFSAEHLPVGKIGLDINCEHDLGS